MKLFIQVLLSKLLKVIYIFPIRKNQIICLHFNGKGYGESPKYIVNELLNTGKNVDIYWVVNDINETTIPSEINKVKYKSFKFFKILYTSKIIINDTRFGLYFSKRKGQIYIQTWHGCLPLKRIEYDAIDKLPIGHLKLMKHDANMTDYMVSNSSFFNELCKRAFLFNGKILKVGCPRNDTLIKGDKGIIKNEVAEMFNIPKDSLIVLYAPTFRNDYTNNPYDIDLVSVKQAIKNKLNHNCEILIKLHPLAIGKYKFENHSNIIIANEYNDTQQLMMAADLIITDYSSIMFEGLVADKTIILYANDIEKYNQERGLYFEFEELPFPLAKNNDELIDIINNNNLDEMKNKYDSFKERLGLVEEGVASRKVCELITTYIDGEDNE